MLDISCVAPNQERCCGSCSLWCALLRKASKQASKQARSGDRWIRSPVTEGAVLVASSQLGRVVSAPMNGIMETPGAIALSYLISMAVRLSNMQVTDKTIEA
jgi:hypothetical protein